MFPPLHYGYYNFYVFLRGFAICNPHSSPHTLTNLLPSPSSVTFFTRFLLAIQYTRPFSRSLPYYPRHCCSSPGSPWEITPGWWSPALGVNWDMGKQICPFPPVKLYYMSLTMMQFYCRCPFGILHCTFSYFVRFSYNKPSSDSLLMKRLCPRN